MPETINHPFDEHSPEFMAAQYKLVEEESIKKEKDLEIKNKKVTIIPRVKSNISRLNNIGHKDHWNN